ncbi:MAG: DUF1905 domain-containing protein, partial [Candidatus Kapabacteria bacterium]|nr:DUF1905 domain-containing protein [Candidatus Kapabacteria bacterium]
ALLPMGDGTFILPLNAAIRKALGKESGDTVDVQMEEDPDGYRMNADFLDAVAADNDAQTFFATLSGSHQRYFSKWIDSAKTQTTRERRIVQAVVALGRRMGYPEMIRAQKTVR